MNMTYKILGTFIGIIVFSAQAAPLTKKAEWTLSVRDSSKLKEVFEQNEWFKQFQQGPMFRGLMYRLAPSLYALGTDHANAWQGKMLDYLSSQILKNLPVTLTYDPLLPAISPFGITLHQLGPAEIVIVKALLKELAGKIKPQQVSFEFDSKKTIAVQPISLEQSKFAAVLHGSCLSLSRDPQLVARLSQKCEFQATSDLELDIDLERWMPKLHHFVSRFSGLGNSLKLKFERKNNSYQIVNAELDLQSDAIRSHSTMNEAFLKAVPADVNLAIMLSSPKPRGLEVDDIKKILKDGVRAKTFADTASVPIWFLHLGLEKNQEQKKLESLSGVLIPSVFGTQGLENLVQLYSGSGNEEVFVKEICSFLILSPNTKFIQRIQDSCEGKRASLKDLPGAERKSLLATTLHGAIVFQSSEWLSGLLSEAWKLENNDEAMSSEIVTARDQLRSLPRVSLKAQRIEDSRMKFEGVAR